MGESLRCGGTESEREGYLPISLLVSAFPVLEDVLCVCVYLRTKHLRTRVNLVDIDQNSRPDFVSIKGRFVFTESEEKRS